MEEAILILYSRKGCCLCEKLEERLNILPLKNINPPLKLKVVDIDSGELTEAERSRYNLEVPVLKIIFNQGKGQLILPRVSPRMGGDQLALWLQRSLEKLNLV